MRPGRVVGLCFAGPILSSGNDQSAPPSAFDNKDVYQKCSQGTRRATIGGGAAETGGCDCGPRGFWVCALGRAQ